MSNEAVRLYDIFELAKPNQVNWMKADSIRTLGYTEMKDLMNKIKEK